MENITMEQIEKRFAEIKEELVNADASKVEDLKKETEELRAKKEE